MRITRTHLLSSNPGKLEIPAIVSAIVVLPFMILELVNRRGLHGEFPIVLFGAMWLLALGFMVILMPVLRDMSGRKQNTLNHLGLIPRIVLLTLIGWLWTNLVLDQMPCFLGVPNCD